MKPDGLFSIPRGMGKRACRIPVYMLTAATLFGCYTYRTASINQKWLDVSYAGVSPAQKLDIYLPNDGSGPFPVIVSIHGGGFAFGSKRGQDLNASLKGLARGYAVASVDYRLSDEAQFPAQINDIKAAIRFLRANAANYKLNPDKFAVWGSSAGGALAALAGTSGGVEEFLDTSLGNAGQSDKVQAVIDWYGPIDFLAMDAQFRATGIKGMVHSSPDSFESKLMGKDITLVPDLVRKANPETYLSRDDPPFFIQHGDSDQQIPIQQSTEFAKKLQEVLGKEKVVLEILPGAGHGDPAFFSTANVAKALDFLDSVLE